MTKTVRIENADMSATRVLVEVWSKGIDGAPDAMISESWLMPTQMFTTYVFGSQYLVVKEAA